MAPWFVSATNALPGPFSNDDEDSRIDTCVVSPLTEPQSRVNTTAFRRPSGDADSEIGILSQREGTTPTNNTRTNAPTANTAATIVRILFGAFIFKCV